MSVKLDFEKCGGLIPAIAQDHKTNEILMMAYINEESWQETLKSGYATYYSRSRQQLWKKGRKFRPFAGDQRYSGRLRP